MSRPRRSTVRKLYRQAIIEYHGCGDKDLDDHIHRAVKKDVHLAGRAPGGWVNPEGVLEIYCESGIPNASDVHYTPHGTHWNSETWCRIDEWVNLALNGMGYADRVFHEPHNDAVIAVHWS
jgi:hypothetical protein